MSKIDGIDETEELSVERHLADDSHPDAINVSANEQLNTEAKRRMNATCFAQDQYGNLISSTQRNEPISILSARSDGNITDNTYSFYALGTDAQRGLPADFSVHHEPGSHHYELLGDDGKPVANTTVLSIPNGGTLVRSFQRNLGEQLVSVNSAGDLQNFSRTASNVLIRLITVLGPDAALQVNGRPNSELPEETIQRALELIRVAVSTMSASLGIQINFPELNLTSKETTQPAPSQGSSLETPIREGQASSSHLQQLLSNVNTNSAGHASVAELNLGAVSDGITPHFTSLSSELIPAQEPEQELEQELEQNPNTNLSTNSDQSVPAPRELETNILVLDMIGPEVARRSPALAELKRRAENGQAQEVIAALQREYENNNPDPQLLKLIISIGQLQSASLAAVVDLLSTQLASNTQSGTAEQSEEERQRFNQALEGLQELAAAGVRLNDEALRAIVSAAAADNAAATLLERGGFAGSSVTPQLGRALLQQILAQLQPEDQEELSHEARLRLLSSVAGLVKFSEPADLRQVLAISVRCLGSSNTTDEQCQQITARLGRLAQACTAPYVAENLRSTLFQYIADEGISMFPAASRPALLQSALQFAENTNQTYRNSALGAISSLAQESEGTALLASSGITPAVREAVLNGLYQSYSHLGNVETIQRISDIAESQGQSEETRHLCRMILLQSVHPDNGADASRAARAGLQRLCPDAASRQALVVEAIDASRSIAHRDSAVTSLAELARQVPAISAEILSAMGSVADNLRLVRSWSNTDSAHREFFNHLYFSTATAPGGMLHLEQEALNQLREDGNAFRPAIETLIALADGAGTAANSSAAIDVIRRLGREPGHEEDIRNIVQAALPGRPALLPLAAALVTGAESVARNNQAALDALSTAARANNAEALALLAAQARESREPGRQALNALMALASADSPPAVSQAARQALLAMAGNGGNQRIWSALLQRYAHDTSLLPLLSAIATRADNLPAANANHIAALTSAASNGNASALELLNSTARAGASYAQSRPALDAIVQVAFGGGIQSSGARDLLLSLHHDGHHRNAIWQALMRQLENSSGNAGSSNETLRLVEAICRGANSLAPGDSYQALLRALDEGNSQAFQAFEAMVRSNGNGSPRALQALLDMANLVGERGGGNWGPGVDMARASLRRLVVEAAAQPQSGATPRRTWLDQYVERVGRGNHSMQETVLALANLTGCREGVLASLLRSYNPNSPMLPLLTAVALERSELPPRPTTPEGITAQWRTNLSELNAEMQRRIGLDLVYPSRTLSARTNAIIDIMTVTAAGPGDRSLCAAQFLARYTNEPASAGTGDWFQRQAALQEMNIRASQILRSGHLTGEQSSYLLNLMFRQLQRMHWSETSAIHDSTNNNNHWVYQSLQAQYVHRALRHNSGTSSGANGIAQGNDVAAMLHIMNRAQQWVNFSAQIPVLEHLSLGTHGETARLESVRLLNWLRDSRPYRYSYNPQDGIDALLSPLRSRQTSIIEEACNAQNLQRIVSFVNANPARATEIVGFLLDAQGNASLSAACRDRLTQSVAAITSAAGQHNAALLRYLAERAPQSDGALNVLYLLGAGRAGSAVVQAAAGSRLLELCRSNEALRTRTIREFSSEHASNAGNLPLLLALLRNSAERPGSWNAALTGLGQLAERGNRQAMALLTTTASGAGASQEQMRSALSEVARIAGVTLDLEPAANPPSRPRSAGQDAFIRLLTLMGERAVNNGNRQCLEILSSMASNMNMPAEPRILAINQLRTAANGPQAEATLNVALAAWRQTQTAPAYSLLACLATFSPPRADIQQALLNGFRDLSRRPAGISDAEYALRRSAAAAGALTDPRYLTPEFIQQMASNMSPQLARALADAEQISPAKSRQLLQALRGQVGTAVDTVSLAQAISSLAPVAAIEDVQALEQLRRRSTPEQSAEINRAILSIITQSPELSIRRAGLDLFRNTAQWTELTDNQKHALTHFAMLGQANLQDLRQACDRVQGANARYPLAVILAINGVRPSDLASQTAFEQWKRSLADSRLGGPAGLLTQAGMNNSSYNSARQRANQITHTDWETCRLAERILKQTSPGSERTLGGWAIPLLTAARLTHPAEEQSGFMTEVARHLASGRLPESIHNLIDWQRNSRAQILELSLRQNQTMQRIAQLETSMREVPGNIDRLYDSVRVADAAYRRAYQAGLDNQELSLPTAPSTSRFNTNERAALQNYQSMHQELIRLYSQLGGLNADLQHRQQQSRQSEYFNAVASGQQAQAANIALNLWGNNRLPVTMAGELGRIWSDLNRRGLTPFAELPAINYGSDNFDRARAIHDTADILRRLAISPTAAALNPADQQLHLAAVDAVTQRCTDVLAHESGLNVLRDLSRRFDGPAQNLMRFFQAANLRESDRENLIPFLEREGQALQNFLQAPETRQAVATARANLPRLQAELITMQPGSIGHHQLSQLIESLSVLAQILDKDGPLGRNIRNMNQFIRDGRLNTPEAWQTVVSVATHVAVGTAAFAVAGALVAGTGGAAAPVLVALLGATLATAGRHATQETLFGLGVSNQGSILQDWLGDGALYDPNANNRQGAFFRVTGGQAGRQVGTEWASDVLIGLISSGVSAGFSTGSRALMNRGILTARFGGPEATTFLARFRQGFNCRELGIGLGMAGAEHLGLGQDQNSESAQGVFSFTQSPMFWAGLLLSGYHGYQDGRTIRLGSPGELHLSTEQRNRLRQVLDSTERSPDRNRLALSNDTLITQGLRCLPRELQATCAQMLLDMPAPQRAQLLRIMPANPQEAGRFLWNIEHLGGARAQLMQHLQGVTPAEQLAFGHNFAAIERPDFVTRISDMIGGTSDTARPELIRRLGHLAPELLSPLLAVPGSQNRADLLATLSSPESAAILARGLQARFQNMRIELRTNFLEGLAAMRDPAARLAVLRDISAHVRGSALIEAVGRITDQSQRRSILESLGQLQSQQRDSFINRFGQSGDPLTRAALLRRVADAPSAERRVIPETMANASEASARLLMDNLAHRNSVPPQNVSAREQVLMERSGDRDRFPANPNEARRIQQELDRINEPIRERQRQLDALDRHLEEHREITDRLAAQEIWGGEAWDMLENLEISRVAVAAELQSTRASIQASDQYRILNQALCFSQGNFPPGEYLLRHNAQHNESLIRLNVSGQHAVPTEHVMRLLEILDDHHITPSSISIINDPRQGSSYSDRIRRIIINTSESARTSIRLNYNHETGHLIGARFFDRQAHQRIMSLYENGLRSAADLVAREIGVPPSSQYRDSFVTQMMNPEHQYVSADTSPTRYRACFDEIFAEMHSLYCEQQRIRQSLRHGEQAPTYAQLLERFTAPGDPQRARIMAPFADLYAELSRTVFEPFRRTNGGAQPSERIRTAVDTIVRQRTPESADISGEPLVRLLRECTSFDDLSYVLQERLSETAPLSHEFRCEVERRAAELVSTAGGDRAGRLLSARGIMSEAGLPNFTENIHLEMYLELVHNTHNGTNVASNARQRLDLIRETLRLNQSNSQETPVLGVNLLREPALSIEHLAVIRDLVRIANQAQSTNDLQTISRSAARQRLADIHEHLNDLIVDMRGNNQTGTGSVRDLAAAVLEAPNGDAQADAIALYLRRFIELGSSLDPSNRGQNDAHVRANRSANVGIFVEAVGTGPCCQLSPEALQRFAGLPAQQQHDLLVQMGAVGLAPSLPLLTVPQVDLLLRSNLGASELASFGNILRRQPTTSETFHNIVDSLRRANLSAAERMSFGEALLNRTITIETFNNIQARDTTTRATVARLLGSLAGSPQALSQQSIDRFLSLPEPARISLLAQISAGRQEAGGAVRERSVAYLNHLLGLPPTDIANIVSAVATFSTHANMMLTSPEQRTVANRETLVQNANRLNRQQLSLLNNAQLNLLVESINGARLESLGRNREQAAFLNRLMGALGDHQQFQNSIRFPSNLVDSIDGMLRHIEPAHLSLMQADSQRTHARLIRERFDRHEPQALRLIGIAAERRYPDALDIRTAQALFGGLSHADACRYLTERSRYLSQAGLDTLFRETLAREMERDGCVRTVSSNQHSYDVQQIYALAESTEGQSLAHMFARSTGIEVVYVTQEQLRRNPGWRSVVFDNMQGQNIEQRYTGVSASIQAQLRAPAEIQGFYQGIDLFDLASVMGSRQNPLLYNQQIETIRRRILAGNVREISGQAPPTEQQLQQLLNIANQPVVARRELAVGGGLSGLYSRPITRGADAAAVAQINIQDALLVARQFRLCNNAQLVRNMQTIHNRLLRDGRLPNNVVFISVDRNAQNPGLPSLSDSSHLSLHLYRRGNGLSAATNDRHFPTHEQLRQRLAAGERLTVVAINDGLGSGEEAGSIARILRQNYSRNGSELIYAVGTANHAGTQNANRLMAGNPPVQLQVGEHISFVDQIARTFLRGNINELRTSASDLISLYQRVSRDPRNILESINEFSSLYAFEWSRPNMTPAQLRPIFEGMGLRGPAARRVTEPN